MLSTREADDKSAHRCKVLMTYTSYPQHANDWRGRFISDLASGLADLPDVELRLWGPPGPIPEHSDYIASPDASRWLDRLQRDGGIAHRLRHRPLGGLWAAAGLTMRLRDAYRQNSNVDVFHINWLQNAIALPRNSIPALITVLGSDFRMLSRPGMVRLLRRVIRHRRTVVCPNGEWMAPALQEYFGDIANVHPVPFGINQRWFNIQRTANEKQSRRWLAVLRVTNAKIGSLFEWGKDVFGADDELHLFGPMQEAVRIPPWVHYHGPTHPESLAQDWFPGAAGMVTLSQHDEGRPQVLLEAMAAGLPVVASAIPAHQDLILNGETGYLVDTADEFRSVLETLRDHDTNRSMGIRARDQIATQFGTWRDCAERYHSLYRRLATGRT